MFCKKILRVLCIVIVFAFGCSYAFAELIWSGDLGPGTPDDWDANDDVCIGFDNEASLSLYMSDRIEVAYCVMADSSNSIASLNVNQGASWHSGSMDVGYSGQASVFITSGIYSSVFDCDGYCWLGDRRGSSGTMNVSGHSASFNVNRVGSSEGELYVGLNGTGELNVLGGASASIESYCGVGYQSTGSGEIDVVRSSFETDRLTVGYLGSGSMELWHSTANTDGNVWIGCESGSDGHVGVYDSYLHVGDLDESFLFHGEDIIYPDAEIYVGFSGNGTLDIVDSWVTVARFLGIGCQNGSTGIVTVDDPDSNLESKFITVGYAGDGVLEISGAKVNPYESLWIACERGSTGRVDVDGGSILFPDSAIVVGDEGQGELNITNGGRVASLNLLYITYDSAGGTGHGIVRVDGPDSALQVGSLYVGRYHEGILEVTNNAYAATNSIYGVGIIKISSGGRLALKLDAHGSLDEFLDHTGDTSLVFRHDSTSEWKSIAQAVRNQDYTLSYHEDGVLAGYTVLTIEQSEYMVGDADTDGDVDIYDFLILRSNYGTTSGAEWADGDFDADGDVDIYDFLNLRSNYGKSN